MMNYYNLKVAIMLKNELRYESTYETLSKFISYSMLKDKELKEKHERNEYKNYVFCSLYPIEKDSIYKLNKIYTFDIRSIDLNFIIKIKQLLSMTENENIKVIMSSIENSQQRNINKLITLTPAIITTEKGDYKIDGNIELVKDRIIANTQKKYKNIFNEELTVDFIDDIIQTNIKPIKIPYKGIYLLGNKFEVTVKQDDESQKLAYLNLAIGMLEKNAEGFRILQSNISI